MVFLDFNFSFYDTPLSILLSVLDSKDIGLIYFQSVYSIAVVIAIGLENKLLSIQVPFFF